MKPLIFCLSAVDYALELPWLVKNLFQKGPSVDTALSLSLTGPWSGSSTSSSLSVDVLALHLIQDQEKKTGKPYGEILETQGLTPALPASPQPPPLSGPQPTINGQAGNYNLR